MTIIDPLTRLRRVVRRQGSQRQAAQSLDVGQSYISDLLRGRRTPSVAVLAKLGLRRVIVQAPQAGA